MEQCVASGQTQDAMQAELARGDGCQMHGFLQVNRVAGNFHLSPGKSFTHANMHIHDLSSFPASSFNVSHRIDQLSFGKPFPGSVNPLDGQERDFGLQDGGGMCMYYIKVRTVLISISDHSLACTLQQSAAVGGTFSSN